MSKTRKIKEYSIEFKGIEYPDYFQGVGVSGTDWDNVYVGVGDTYAEAYDDAVENCAQSDYSVADIPDCAKENKDQTVMIWWPP